MRAWILAGAVFATGCSTAGAPAGGGATPNPGAEYLAIVRPSNDAADALRAASSASPPDLPRIRAAATTLRNADSTFATKLLTLESHVQPSIRPDLEVLRKQIADEVAALGPVIQSDGEAELAALLRYLEVYKAGDGKAELVRADLGLPPPTLATPSATASRSPAPAAPPAPGFKALSFTGTGGKITERFFLPAGAYKLAWKASGARSDLFEVTVHQAAEKRLAINEVPPNPASGEGEYDSASGGSAYLEIQAGALTWSITITAI